MSELEKPSEAQDKRRDSHEYNDARALPAIVKAMLRPAFYPEPPEKVELVQTHISYVFLAGGFVYKLKKPARFSFIDCADVRQRRHLCVEEIRLNRRLAPDVYLGIYPVIWDGADFVLDEKSNHHRDAADYVVKMRRLPDNCMLDRMVARHEADRATMTSLASIVVDFYRSTSSAQAWRYAAASRLWQLVMGELLEVEKLVGATITAGQFRTIEDYCGGYIASHWRMLNARAETGRVREGHGDLRAEHICIENGKISIFDCVEFSERLRTCDLASESAFLAMDLDRLDAHALADQFVDAVAEAAQDEDLALLMPFYKCYRAVIRGLVETLRSGEEEIDPAQRASATALAQRYFSLAQSYAIDAAPALVVVCGLSGTGKSTIARALQNRFGFPIVNSDRTRKKLSAVAVERHAVDAYKAGIYADAITESTYTAMLADAEQQLRAANGVILDATFQDRAHRKAALDLGNRSKVPILFLECRAEDAEIRRRLTERQKTGNNPSDATVEVYLRQREDFAELAEIPPPNHLMVDTTLPIDVIVSTSKTAMERLRR
jgi:hypothetical protein